MPGKLLKTVLWCGLLVLLAGGLLTVAGSQAAGAVKPEVVTKEATSGQIVNLRFATKLASFVPRQELYEHGGGRISASIQIHEENRETFMDVDGGRLTLIRANGEHLVTAHVDHSRT